MKMSSKRILNAIRPIRTKIQGLQPTDQNTMIEIGAAIEDLASDLSDFDAVTLMELCLEGLQALYTGTCGQPERMIGAIENALDMLENTYADAGREMDKRALDNAIRMVGRASSKNGEPPDSTSTVDGRMPVPEIQTTDEQTNLTQTRNIEWTIHDLAAFLISLESGDTQAVQQLQPALDDLITQSGWPEEVITRLEHARQQVDTCIERGFTEVDGMLQNVSAAIEQAVAVIEKSEIDATSDIKDTGSADQTAEDEDNPGSTTLDILVDDTDMGLLEDWITESREYVEEAETALLALETDPGDDEAVNTVFRAFHTMKGTAGFLGFSGIGTFAHHAECLFSRMRDGEIRCTGVYADLALQSVDLLKDLIQAVRQTAPGTPVIKPKQYDPFLKILMDVETADQAEAVPPAPVPHPASVPASLPPKDVADEQHAIREVDEPDEDRADIVQTTDTSESAARESSVRVRTERLDRLIDMVGELVISQAMIAQDPSVAGGMDEALLRKVTHTGKIVRELQDLSMSMRMVPLKATARKLARLVRDLARKSGKRIVFSAEGEDTEIDRNMVDYVTDPLVHMIRNAVDHGIESPEERADVGKPLTGKISLHAYHAGGNVVLVLQDDGRGLDREKIHAKGIQNGLLTADKQATDREVFNLIFSPGFSTAAAVTDISGRGVGMDVVRRNIEALHGRIDIQSEKGFGSMFTFSLPLTLAVTDGMLVRVGQEKYIIPMVNIGMNLRPEKQMLSTIANRGEIVTLKDEVIPLLRLHRLFGIAEAVKDPTQGLLVIVGDEDRRCAILVDELSGQQHAVVKSLGDGIGKVAGVSGGAVLGDGRVGLILDIPELISMARRTDPAGKIDRSKTAA